MPISRTTRTFRFRCAAIAAAAATLPHATALKVNQNPNLLMLTDRTAPAAVPDGDYETEAVSNRPYPADYFISRFAIDSAVNEYRDVPMSRWEEAYGFSFPYVDEYDHAIRLSMGDTHDDLDLWRDDVRRTASADITEARKWRAFPRSFRYLGGFRNARGAQAWLHDKLLKDTRWENDYAKKTIERLYDVIERDYAKRSEELEDAERLRLQEAEPEVLDNDGVEQLVDCECHNGDAGEADDEDLKCPCAVEVYNCAVPVEMYDGFRETDEERAERVRIEAEEAAQRARIERQQALKAAVTNFFFKAAENALKPHTHGFLHLMNAPNTGLSAAIGNVGTMWSAEEQAQQRAAEKSLAEAAQTQAAQKQADEKWVKSLAEAVVAMKVAGDWKNFANYYPKEASQGSDERCAKMSSNWETSFSVLKKRTVRGFPWKQWKQNGDKWVKSLMEAMEARQNETGEKKEFADYYPSKEALQFRKPYTTEMFQASEESYAEMKRSWEEALDSVLMEVERTLRYQKKESKPRSDTASESESEADFEPTNPREANLVSIPCP